ncbi:magnesium/cobalt transporter CorA [Salibacter halophilus]|uniref:Magnesium transport protein CorA n=1 Tax=Salibacter halophilus TaxID=1803916 RepID=A0A6N6M7G4_9FLAO|nr:magnesium/cobalt transporter CorA [Salibacter halophilus]KAB1066010.1 magnesium/cobalt transporter CorA [Salibacter halophilus]
MRKSRVKKKASHFSQSSKKVGLAPGSLIYTGEERNWEPEISLITYDKENLDLQKIDQFSHLPDLNSNKVSWINIDGIHDVDLIKQVGSRFDLHSLVLEDVVNANQRPKIEEFENYLFFTVRVIRVEEKDTKIHEEQISFVLGDHFVLSFQEHKGDIFSYVRERLKNKLGRLRSAGSDYLVYALLDTIVDHYFVVEENITLRIENHELDIIQNQGSKNLSQMILGLKDQVLIMRKAVVPLREAVANLKKGTSSLIADETINFLNDLYDHINHQIDGVEMSRDSITNLIELNSIYQNNKLNEIMKVLTMISTIFIPLSFLAGLYGMNFNNMPELEYRYGYYWVLTVMGILIILMILFFKRKKWL